MPAELPRIPAELPAEQARDVIITILRQLRTHAELADLSRRRDRTSPPWETTRKDERYLTIYGAQKLAELTAEYGVDRTAVGRRLEEARSLSDRVQRGLDLENHGDWTNGSDRYDRTYTIAQRAEEALTRAQLRQASRTAHSLTRPRDRDEREEVGGRAR